MKKIILIMAAMVAAFSANAQVSFKPNSNGLYLDYGNTLSLGRASNSRYLFYPQIMNGDESTQFFMVCENGNRSAQNEKVMTVDAEGGMILNGNKAGIQLWQYDVNLTQGMAAHVSLSFDQTNAAYSLSANGGHSPAPMYYKASTHYFKGDLNVSGRIECNGEFKVVEVNTDQINTKDIKINMNNVADYVFEKGYDLKDLYEVENYVNENKHLPGVPSAAEIESEGVSVSKMTNILLEKVEELTLHMIQLKKENEMLRQTIENMQK